MKKKVWGTVLTVLALTAMLCGCMPGGGLAAQSDEGYRVETLKDWSFQYNKGSDDYSLFFSLADGDGQPLTSSAEVELRIVNDEDEVVYEGSGSVDEEDFGYYSNEIKGERYLANLRIPAEEIMPGKSADGTVYFTVQRPDVFAFDECKCEVLFGLPVKDIEFSGGDLPQEVCEHSYMGGVAAKFRIDSVEGKVDMDYSPKINVIISGEKLSESGDFVMNMFSYKLYDSEDYVTDSGTIYLEDIAPGDKFRHELTIYDVVPGEHYTIRFADGE